MLWHTPRRNVASIIKEPGAGGSPPTVPPSALTDTARDWAPATAARLAAAPRRPPSPPRCCPRTPRHTAPVWARAGRWPRRWRTATAPRSLGAGREEGVLQPKARLKVGRRGLGTLRSGAGKSPEFTWDVQRGRRQAARSGGDSRVLGTGDGQGPRGRCLKRRLGPRAETEDGA